MTRPILPVTIPPCVSLNLTVRGNLLVAVGIAIILLLGFAVDGLCQRVRVPAMVGFILLGILGGPYALGVIAPELLAVSADVRTVALAVLLLRAGLGLKVESLRRVGWVVLLLAVLPGLGEGVAVALLAPLLFPLTPMEGALLGAILTAVSPAVVIHFMLQFMERRLGTGQGIPTLILGASALNVILSVVAFSILMGLYSGQGEGLGGLVAIPEAVVLGILSGVLLGSGLHALFKRFQLRPTKMTFVVVAVSVLLTWFEGSISEWLSCSALLGVMTIGFVLLGKDRPMAQNIADQLGKIWIVAEVLLFVLVGAQVNIQVALTAGAAGATLILAGLAVRSLGGALSLWGSRLNGKERAFCIISYVPKATVQAALGAVPLEMGVPGGEIILAISVLAILVTVPLGAMGMQSSGPRFLRREDPV